MNQIIILIIIILILYLVYKKYLNEKNIEKENTKDDQKDDSNLVNSNKNTSSVNNVNQINTRVDCSLDIGEWSSCDTSTGTKTRTITKVVKEINGGSCNQSEDVKTETKNCSINCELETSEWSDCNKLTGIKTRTITKKIKEKNGGVCNQVEDMKIETENCKVDCVLETGEWSDCNKQTGIKTRTITKEIKEKNGGECNQSEDEKIENELCPVDCEYDENEDNYQILGDCNCSTNKQRVRKLVKFESKNGGKECEGNNELNIECNPEDCLIKIKYIKITSGQGFLDRKYISRIKLFNKSNEEIKDWHTYKSSDLNYIVKLIKSDNTEHIINCKNKQLIDNNNDFDIIVKNPQKENVENDLKFLCGSINSLFDSNEGNNPNWTLSFNQTTNYLDNYIMIKVKDDFDFNNLNYIQVHDIDNTNYSMGYSHKNAKISFITNEDKEINLGVLDNNTKLDNIKRKILVPDNILAQTSEESLNEFIEINSCESNKNIIFLELYFPPGTSSYSGITAIDKNNNVMNNWFYNKENTSTTDEYAGLYHTPIHNLNNLRKSIGRAESLSAHYAPSFVNLTIENKIRIKIKDPIEFTKNVKNIRLYTKKNLNNKVNVALHSSGIIFKIELCDNTIHNIGEIEIKDTNINTYNHNFTEEIYNQNLLRRIYYNTPNIQTFLQEENIIETFNNINYFYI